MASPNNTAIELADVRIETWPLAQPFVISRGAKTEAQVLVVELTCDGKTGRGEAVPYARYGETLRSALELARQPWPRDRNALRSTMPAGAARNALDCALWDIEAKMSGQPLAHQQSSKLRRFETCYTISLGTPEAMAAQALDHPNLKLLKLKLGGEGDDQRMRAVRAARPDARLVADANEAWSPANTVGFLAVAQSLGFETIEQPLPADADQFLAEIDRAVPVCADESVHTSEDLADLKNRYDAVNIKLDKAGGLTEARAMANEARQLGLKIMVGSMVATSLAVAPALLLAEDAEWIDLDGPLLLARDREHGLTITNGLIAPPSPLLWG